MCATPRSTGCPPLPQCSLFHRRPLLLHLNLTPYQLKWCLQLLSWSRPGGGKQESLRAFRLQNSSKLPFIFGCERFLCRSTSCLRDLLRSGSPKHSSFLGEPLEPAACARYTPGPPSPGHCALSRTEVRTLYARQGSLQTFGPF